jgi:dipeptidyl aminopeptidase/acylaminoacyl peptidase
MRILFSLVGFVLVAAAPAAEKRLITPEDLWKVKRVGPPTISPDGKWCAVEVTTWNIEANDSASQIWLLSTDGKTQKQLTHFGEPAALAAGSGGGKNSNPKWSPDGKWIAFTSKRGGDDVPQIYVIAAEGGEARRVSNMPFAPSALKWSGDSSTVYCIAWTWPDTRGDAAYKKRDKEKKEAKSKAVVIDDAMFRYWDKWLTDGKRPYVFAVDLKSGTHENLMEGTGHHLPVQQPGEEHYDVSPDGKELCYVHDNVKEIGLDVNLDLFTLKLHQKKVAPKCITEDNKANDFNPVYSPDGAKIAFLRQTTKFFYADQTRVMVRNCAANRQYQVTPSKGFDAHVLSISRWYPDGSQVNANVEFGGFIIAGAFVNWESQLPYPYSTAIWADSSRNRVNSANNLVSVFTRASFGRPDSVASSMANPEAQDVRKLTSAPLSLDHFNEDLVAQWKLGKVENRTIKGAGGRDVQMFVVYPPDFDPAKKWPLVQMVHGGPHNAFINDFNFRWNPHVWAARGWVVAIVNFHGSSGFGQEFTDSITGDLGTKPMEDIMKATDWFEQQPWIDKNRIAAAGASYGGFMMAWLNGHTDRFKAMVCHAGVYNWHSMLASDIIKSRERSLGAPPWGNLEKIDKQSPQRFAKNFKTPTLVLHGEQDFRVPVTQGFEYYNTLRQKGVPTRLVYFPDENHWISKPQNSLIWHREVFAWLEKYIGSGPTK